MLVAIQKWEAIEKVFNPPPDYAEAHGGQVILYATSWCAYCKKTRKLLEENYIPYYEYNIETSQEGRKQYDKLGGRGVPVLLIGGVVVNGYRPAEILELAKN